MKYLIVGLGNPGIKYEDTRHNIGFKVLDKLAEKLNVFSEPDKQASTALGKYKGRQLCLVWPTTYMNLSGKAVRYHMQKNKIPLENVLIITDDIALSIGQTRLKTKGSDGGHNGLKSINELLNTQAYVRMCIGVGNNFASGKQSDYVLAPFKEDEKSLLPEIIDKCVNGILSFATIGIGRTMNEFNKKKS